MTDHPAEGQRTVESARYIDLEQRQISARIDGATRLVTRGGYLWDAVQAYIDAGGAVADYAPPAEGDDLDRAVEIHARLDAIDKTTRPVRAVAAALATGTTPDADDVARVVALEREAESLRLALAALSAPSSDAATAAAGADALPFRATSGKVHTAACGYGKDGAPCTWAYAMEKGLVPCTRCAPAGA